MNRYVCTYEEILQELRIGVIMYPIRRDIEYGALYINDHASGYGHSWKMWLYADSIGEATKKFMEVMRLD